MSERSYHEANSQMFETTKITSIAAKRKKVVVVIGFFLVAFIVVG